MKPELSLRVNRRQIADMFGASLASADNWTRRYPEFPKPGDDGLWDRAEVAAWHENRWPGGDKMYHLRKGQRDGTAYRASLETIRDLAYRFGHHSDRAAVQDLLTVIVDTANMALNGKAPK